MLGLAGEDQVALNYRKRGAKMLASRWRGSQGEIDLIFQECETFVFVEVKTSNSLERALQSLRPAQISRIIATASEFLSTTPDGQSSHVRFDVAAVSLSGDVQICESALTA